jgi:hypothetical protein
MGPLSEPSASIDQQLFEVRRMAGDDYVFALSPPGGA